MKKHAALLLALCLALCCISSLALADWTMYVCTNGGHLNVRDDCYSGAEILGRLSYGQKVTVVDQIGNWSEILFGSGTGWVNSSYLSSYRPGNPYPSPTAAPAEADLSQYYRNFQDTNQYAFVVNNSGSFSNYVNLRWGPGKNFPIKSVRYVGTQMRVIASNGSWCQVVDMDGNCCGFMSANFLSFGVGAY